MPFTRVNPGDLIQAQNLNQVLGSLNGTAGQGVPITQTSVNDASNYALSVQNLEATNSRAISVVKSDGTLLIRGDATGVSLGSPLNLASGSVQGGTAIAAGSITNDRLGPDVARANLLTNPGFEVWQRGNGAFTANGAWTADRWQLNLAGTSTASVSKSTSTVDTGSAASAQITYTHNAVSPYQQKIEDINQLRGRTISLSIRVNASAANAVRLLISFQTNSGSNTYSTYHTGGSTWQTLTATASVPSNETNVYINVSLEASCTAYLDNAMLIVGSTPADYVPLHPADDLARCLRYYEKHYPEIFAYVVNAGSACGYGVPFRAIKPVAPTITKVGTWVVGNSQQPVAGSRANTNETNTMYFQAVALATGNLNVNPLDSTTVITVEANP